MNKRLKILVNVALLSLTLTGCGGEGGTNVPAVKLISSPVVSAPADHGHRIEIPFSDIDLASDASFTATVPFQYRSSDNTGHSHVIALSKQQLIDLNNGMKLSTLSSVQSPLTGTGSSHTHTWDILGGNVLYDKHCYNCHSNDKRGDSPMNVSFNAAQTSAVRNPASASVSSSANAATPDPDYMPSPELSLDGVILYGKYCESCHNSLEFSTKTNKSANQIKLGMGSMGLTDIQLQAIATALIK